MKERNIKMGFAVGGIPLTTIEELRDTAYAIMGEPDPVQFEDRIVGITEARDGTIMDVVRQVYEEISYHGLFCKFPCQYCICEVQCVK